MMIRNEAGNGTVKVEFGTIVATDHGATGRIDERRWMYLRERNPVGWASADSLYLSLDAGHVVTFSNVMVAESFVVVDDCDETDTFTRTVSSGSGWGKMP